MATTKAKDRSERAAAAVREQQRRERRRQIFSVTGVVLAMVLIIGAGFVINSIRDSSDDVAAAAPATGSDLGLTIGPDSAPHKLVVYEDFLCPFCGAFEAGSHEELESLAQAGKVQVEYRPFPLLTSLGDYSEDSLEAFSAVLTQSGPDAALAMHDLLFADQPSEEGPFPSRSDLADVMKQAGADDATVEYFENGDAKGWAGEAADAAASSGVTGTPTIILDQEPYTNGSSIEALAENLLKDLQ